MITIAAIAAIAALVGVLWLIREVKTAPYDYTLWPDHYQKPRDQRDLDEYEHWGPR